MLGFYGARDWPQCESGKSLEVMFLENKCFRRYSYNAFGSILTAGRGFGSPATAKLACDKHLLCKRTRFSENENRFNEWKMHAAIFN